MMTANNGKDYINRYAVLNAINDAIAHNALSYDGCVNEIMEFIAKMPAADVRPVKRGKWEQEEVFEAKGHVDELQSAFCPVCQRYHTTPYSYYFTHYNFCPNCGADMREES